VSLTILELNDIELTVARGGKVLVRSPGVALLRDGRLETGDKALKAAHLEPRHAFNRFWRDLQQVQLPVVAPQARHHADLAWAQLQELHAQSGKPKEMLFAVPGSFTSQQLSLLLGLVQASPFALAGLLDSAVAAVAAGAPRGLCQHLELHLHHAVLTTLQVSEQAHRTGVRVIDGAGLVAIHDRCAAFIADRFVQQVRLDPLHHARPEQALYDQLPQCLHALQQRGEALVEIPFDGGRHQVRVARDELVRMLEPIYVRLLEGFDAGAHALFGHRVAALPGLTARVPACRVLEPMAVFNGCAGFSAAPAGTDAGISFVTRLPAVAIESAPQPVRTANGRVTHVLVGSTAWPLSATALFIGAGTGVSRERQPDSLCSLSCGDSGAVLRVESPAAAYLNGRGIGRSATLEPGDRVSFAGTDLTLVNISVVPADGA
jgi:hypothetical protein